jgi:hypothetical protein
MAVKHMSGGNLNEMARRKKLENVKPRCQPVPAFSRCLGI